MKMKYEIELDTENANAIWAMVLSSDGVNDVCLVPIKPIEEDPKTPKRCRADKGGKYFSISDDGEICHTIDLHTSFEDRLYRFGNYYKTEEEAAFTLERLKVMGELELYTAKEIDESISYWGIVYDRDDNTVRLTGCASVICTDPFMFASKEDAEAAIDAIGEERLKKYFFRIKED